jgi:hypothetical protein
MSDEETKPESEEKSEEWCGSKDRWHKHHHKHHRAYHAGPMMGPVWFIGWLFTIGYLHMPFFWKGVLTLIIWPYYLGAALVH